MIKLSKTCYTDTDKDLTPIHSRGLGIFHHIIQSAIPIHIFTTKQCIQFATEDIWVSDEFNSKNPVQLHFAIIIIRTIQLKLNNPARTIQLKLNNPAEITLGQIAQSGKRVAACYLRK